MTRILVRVPNVSSSAIFTASELLVDKFILNYIVNRYENIVTIYLIYSHVFAQTIIWVEIWVTILECIWPPIFQL